MGKIQFNSYKKTSDELLEVANRWDKVRTATAIAFAIAVLSHIGLLAKMTLIDGSISYTLFWLWAVGVFVLFIVAEVAKAIYLRKFYAYVMSTGTTFRSQLKGDN